MAKRITRIVLTGGPAAGKTTLISRILKEFKQDDGWKVITIPETATELISGFGIRPFGIGLRMDANFFIVRFDAGMKAIDPAYTGRKHYPILHHDFDRDFAFHFAVGLPF